MVINYRSYACLAPAAPRGAVRQKMNFNENLGNQANRVAPTFRSGDAKHP